MTGFLRNTDAFTWAMDSDPRLRSARMRRALLGSGPIPKR
jgi:diacylglycerol O-acyltransferase / wax synthase